MKKLLSTMLVLSGGLVAGGCAINNSNIGYGGQPTGVVYSNYNTPGSIADATVKPLKTGKACTEGVLWVSAWGNAGTNDAMQNGGITKLANVQYSNYSILSGIYSEYCTIATGE